MPKRAVSITLDPAALDQLHAWRNSKGSITLSEAITILVQLFATDPALQEKVWERTKKGQELAKQAAREADQKARKEQMDAAWKKWLNPETRAEGEKDLYALTRWPPNDLEEMGRMFGYIPPKAKPQRQAKPIETPSPPLSPPQECGRVSMIL